MGGGSKTVSAKIPNATPEEKALFELVNRYDTLTSGQGIDLTKQAYELLGGITSVDWQKEQDSADDRMKQIYGEWDNLYQGKLNEEYQKNMETALQRGYENTLGGSINKLGNRGVLNSKVTSSAINDQQKNLNTQMAQSYQTNLGLAGDMLKGKEGNISQGLDNLAQAQNSSLLLPTTYYTIGSTLANNAQNDWQTMYNARYKLAQPAQTIQKGSVLGGLVTGLAGAFCFAKGTLIGSYASPLFVEDVVVGDEVLTPSGTEIVQAVSGGHLSLDQYICITFEEMETGKFIDLITTVSQSIGTPKGFVLADTLCLADMVTTIDGDCPIVDIYYIDDKEMVYDIQVSGQNVFFANKVLVNGGEYL